MEEKEKQQLKSNLKSRLDYFYAKLDHTYRIPNNVEGESIALMLITFYDVPEDKVFLYDENNTAVLYDIDGHEYRERTGYERVD